MTVVEQLNTRLTGRYAIERELGRGGMATVYLARDLRHDRHVALKVLDPELGAVLGGERFLSEIRVTAHLQHPNLLPLFDSGDADGLLFYVMPFIEGESLRAKLDHEQQLPVDDAVRIAVAVASAVDYAHRHGVVHRDLKPENILLHDGQPLVADFGIALAVTNAGGGRITQTGLSLGTPQYMSPEQATGDRAVDGRTDVYSLGAMTYEMLCGEAPHTGRSAQAIIAKLMTEEPRPVTALRRTVPPHVSAAVHCALQKLPADRFGTAREFAEALQGRGFAPPSPVDVIRFAPRTPWRAIAIGALAFAGMCAAAASWGLRRSAVDVPQLVVRFPIAIDPAPASFLRSFDLSPDGAQFAFIGGVDGNLFVRRMSDLEPSKVVGPRIEMPQFSPDGRQLAFISAGTLKRIAVGGGVATTIADDVGSFAWGSAGVIAFGKRAWRTPALFTVGENGGRIDSLTPQPRAGEAWYASPSFLPDGDGVLFAISAAGTYTIAVIRRSDRKVVRLGIAGSSPRYLSSGHILSITGDGTGVLTPFNDRTLEVTGASVTVLDEVTVELSGAEFAVSRSGTLAYLPAGAPQQLVEVDREGRTTRVLSPETRQFRNPRYSPDGKRIVVGIGRSAPSTNIWVLEVGSGNLDQLTNEGGSSTPEWSSDGKRIGWTRTTGTAPGTYWRPWDRSEPPELLVAGSRGTAFSPTGGFMITNLFSPAPISAAVRLDSSRRQTRIIEASAPQFRVSPDGAWLAYSTINSGGRETSIRSVEGRGGEFQISNNASEPVWNPKGGGELFYRSGSHLISAKIDFSPYPHVMGRDTLFSMNLGSGGVQAQYHVAPDGNHFLFPRPVTAGTTPVIVVNWLDEVRERLRPPLKK